MDDVIKTTARFQEANQPIKQKPVIQIHTDSLPNTIRASLDSGRDNPFRPDGEIYKSADPIVDFYKFGPNQSRNNSPCDGQLLINDDTRNSITKLTKTKQEKRKRSKNISPKNESCWRRWICCYCCRCNRNNISSNSNQSSNLTNQEKTKEEKQQSSGKKIASLKDDESTPIVTAGETITHIPESRQQTAKKQLSITTAKSIASSAKLTAEDTPESKGVGIQASKQSSKRCVVS